MFMLHDKWSWNKLKTIIIPNTFNWQLKNWSMAVDVKKFEIKINVSFPYLKTCPSYFFFLSHLIRIYKRNYNGWKLLPKNHHTVINSFQNLFIIPKFLSVLFQRQLIVILNSFLRFVNLKYAIVNAFNWQLKINLCT